MTGHAASLVISTLLALPLLGCAEVAQSNARPSLGPCKEVGQRCEVSAGKLGSCVLRDDCREGDCYVCQSQH